MIRTVLWKELLDLSRDRKTLASVILLPMLGLPGLALLAGALASTQTILVAIIQEDENATSFVENLSSSLQEAVAGMGYRVNVTIYRGGAPEAADLLVIVPKGFTANLSRIDGRARLLVSISLGPGGEAASQALQKALRSISEEIVLERIEELASRANETVNPEGVLDPIQAVSMYHEATGAPAPPGRAEAAFTARLLEFAFLFVVNPAVVYMADSIVGERERRTMEKLLLAPVSKLDLLAGKMLASFILGFAASLMDAAGILLFFLLSGLPVTVTGGLAIVWGASAALVILVTSALVAAVSARSETARGAQNASFIVLAAAMAVYFAALLVDLSRVPEAVSLALQLIPFTHAALAVHTYAVGEPNAPLLHIAALLGFLAAFLLLAVRSFEEEKLVMYR